MRKKYSEEVKEMIRKAEEPNLIIYDELCEKLAKKNGNKCLKEWEDEHI